MAKGSLRTEMPIVAKIVDDFRDAFGADNINSVIRRGIQGEPGRFHAVENGHEIGTPFPSHTRVGHDSKGNCVLLSGAMEPETSKPETNREKHYRKIKDYNDALRSK